MAALPGMAQESPTGPLTRAAMREAARLAAEGEPVSAAAAGSTSTASDWSLVRQLAPGGEIVVTVKSSWSASVFFVAADDRELVVRSAAGQIEHVPRDDVAEIKREHSKVLYAAMGVVIATVLIPVGGAIGYAIGGGEGEIPPSAFLGAIVVPLGAALLVRALFPRVKVIYRSP